MNQFISGLIVKTLNDYITNLNARVSIIRGNLTLSNLVLHPSALSRMFSSANPTASAAAASESGSGGGAGGNSSSSSSSLPAVLPVRIASPNSRAFAILLETSPSSSSSSSPPPPPPHSAESSSTSSDSAPPPSPPPSVQQQHHQNSHIGTLRIHIPPLLSKRAKNPFEIQLDDVVVPVTFVWEEEEEEEEEHDEEEESASTKNFGTDRMKCEVEDILKKPLLLMFDRKFPESVVSRRRRRRRRKPKSNPFGIKVIESVLNNVFVVLNRVRIGIVSWRRGCIFGVRVARIELRTVTGPGPTGSSSGARVADIGRKEVRVDGLEVFYRKIGPDVLERIMLSRRSERRRREDVAVVSSDDSAVVVGGVTQEEEENESKSKPEELVIRRTNCTVALSIQKLGKGMDFQIPQLSVSASLPNLVGAWSDQMHFDAVQVISDLVSTRKVLVGIPRPLVPIRGHPRPWWRFAIRAVIAKNRSRRMSWQRTREWLIDRRDYILLYKKRIRARRLMMKNPFHKLFRKELRKPEMERFDAIESKWKVQQIIWLRRTARLEMKAEDDAALMGVQQRRGRGRGRGQVLPPPPPLTPNSSGGVAAASAGDAFTESQRQELLKALELEDAQSVELPPDFVRLQLRFDLCRGVLSFVDSMSHKAFGKLSVAGVAGTINFSDTEVRTVFSVDDLGFRDDSCPVFPRVISSLSQSRPTIPALMDESESEEEEGETETEMVSSARATSASSSALLRVEFARIYALEADDRETLFICVEANRLSVVVYPQLLQHLYGFFSLEGRQRSRVLPSLAKRIAEKAKETMAQRLEEPENNMFVDLRVDLKAPNIYGPLHCEDPDSRFVLFRLGNLSVRTNPDGTQVVGISNFSILIPQLRTVAEMIADIDSLDLVPEKSVLVGRTSFDVDVSYQPKIHLASSVDFVSINLSPANLRVFLLFIAIVGDSSSNPSGLYSTVDLRMDGEFRAIGPFAEDWVDVYGQVRWTQRSVFLYNRGKTDRLATVFLNPECRVESIGDSDLILHLWKEEDHFEKFHFFFAASAADGSSSSLRDAWLHALEDLLAEEKALVLASSSADPPEVAEFESPLSLTFCLKKLSLAFWKTLDEKVGTVDFADVTLRMLIERGSVRFLFHVQEIFGYTPEGHEIVSARGLDDDLQVTISFLTFESPLYAEEEALFIIAFRIRKPILFHLAPAVFFGMFEFGFNIQFVVEELLQGIRKFACVDQKFLNPYLFKLVFWFSDLDVLGLDVGKQTMFYEADSRNTYFELKVNTAGILFKFNMDTLSLRDIALREDVKLPILETSTSDSGSPSVVSSGSQDSFLSVTVLQKFLLPTMTDTFMGSVLLRARGVRFWFLWRNLLRFHRTFLDLLKLIFTEERKIVKRKGGPPQYIEVDVLVEDCTLAFPCDHTQTGMKHFYEGECRKLVFKNYINSSERLEHELALSNVCVSTTMEGMRKEIIDEMELVVRFGANLEEQFSMFVGVWGSCFRVTRTQYQLLFDLLHCNILSASASGSASDLGGLGAQSQIEGAAVVEDAAQAQAAEMEIEAEPEEGGEGEVITVGVGVTEVVNREQISDSDPEADPEVDPDPDPEAAAVADGVATEAVNGEHTSDSDAEADPEAEAEVGADDVEEMEEVAIADDDDDNDGWTGFVLNVSVPRLKLLICESDHPFMEVKLSDLDVRFCHQFAENWTEWKLHIRSLNAFDRTPESDSRYSAILSSESPYVVEGEEKEEEEEEGGETPDPNSSCSVVVRFVDDSKTRTVSVVLSSMELLFVPHFAKKLADFFIVKTSYSRPSKLFTDLEFDETISLLQVPSSPSSSSSPPIAAGPETEVVPNTIRFIFQLGRFSFLLPEDETVPDPTFLVCQVQGLNWNSFGFQTGTCLTQLRLLVRSGHESVNLVDVMTLLGELQKTGSNEYCVNLRSKDVVECRLSFADVRTIIAVISRVTKFVKMESLKEIAMSNEAVLLQKSIPKGYRTALSIEFPFSLFLVDDLLGFDVPILTLMLEKFSTSLALETGSTSLGFESTTTFYPVANYFNSSCAEWEPLIERSESQLHLELGRAANSSVWIVSVSYPGCLNLNITREVLRLGLRMGKSILPKAENPNAPNPTSMRSLPKRFFPYCVRNRTGWPLQFTFADDLYSLQDGEKVRFGKHTPFKTSHDLMKLNVYLTGLTLNGRPVHLRRNAILISKPQTLKLRVGRRSRLLIEILQTEVGTKNVVFHSQIRMVNATTVPWKVGCWLESPDEPILLCESLAPNESLYVPVACVYSGLLSLLPLVDIDDSQEFMWLKQSPLLGFRSLVRRNGSVLLSWKSVPSLDEPMYHLEDAPPDESTRLSFFCVLRSSLRRGCATIRLIPPFCVENLLCCDIAFVLSALKKKRQLPEERSPVLSSPSKRSLSPPLERKTICRARLSPGKSLCLYRVNMKKRLWMRCRAIQPDSGVRWKFPKKKNKKELPVLVYCPANSSLRSRWTPAKFFYNVDHLNRRAKFSIRYDRKNSVAPPVHSRISIFCPFWFVNRTSLSVMIRANGTDVAGQRILGEEEEGEDEDEEMSSSVVSSSQAAAEDVALFEEISLTSPPAPHVVLPKTSSVVLFDHVQANVLFANSITLFFPDDQCVTRPFSIDEVNAPKPMQAVGDRRRIAVCVNVRLGAGKFNLTRIVDILPLYVLVNRVGEPLNIKEAARADGSSDGLPSSSSSSDDVIRLGVDGVLPLYWRNKGSQREKTRLLPPRICVTLSDSDTTFRWSVPFSLRLLGQSSTDDISLIVHGLHDLLQMRFLVVKVHEKENGVRFGVISRSSNPPYFIENRSSQSVQFSQYAVGEWTVVHPTEKLPYSWENVFGKHCLVIKTSSDASSGGGYSAFVDVDIVSFRTRIRQAQLAISVVVEDVTRTVLIEDFCHRGGHSSSVARATETEEEEEETSVDQLTSAESDLLRCIIDFGAIGISLIDAESSREVLYAYLDTCKCLYRLTTVTQLLELGLGRIKVNNQLPETNLPVAFANANKLDDDEFFFTLACLRRHTEKEFQCIPYFSVRIREADLVADMYLINQLRKFFFVNTHQLLIEEEEQSSSSSSYFEEDPLSLETGVPSLLRSPSSSDRPSSASKKTYIQHLQFHAFHVNVSFLFNEIDDPKDESDEDTNSPEKAASRGILLSAFETLGVQFHTNIQEVPIVFPAFVLRHPFVALPRIVENVKTYYKRHLISEVYKVIGSFNFIGNPVGLAQDLDDGFEDLFHEPLSLLSVSPSRVPRSLASGSLSFLKHSVHGTFSTVSKLTETLGNGVSSLTMDPAYTLRRRLSHARKTRHVGDGLVTGLRDFGWSFLDGATGLFTQPVRGAADGGGVSGFLVGLGRGIVGLPLKPIAGVLDLATKTTRGIKNTATYFEKEEACRSRLPRVFALSGAVIPYDADAAEGQAFLHTCGASGSGSSGSKKGTTQFAQEKYIDHCEVVEDKLRPRMVVLLSHRHLLYLEKDGLVIQWMHALSEIDTVEEIDPGFVIRLKRGPEAKRPKEGVTTLWGLFSVEISRRKVATVCRNDMPRIHGIGRKIRRLME